MVYTNKKWHKGLAGCDVVCVALVGATGSPLHWTVNTACYYLGEAAVCGSGTLSQRWRVQVCVAGLFSSERCPVPAAASAGIPAPVGRITKTINHPIFVNNFCILRPPNLEIHNPTHTGHCESSQLAE